MLSDADFDDEDVLLEALESLEVELFESASFDGEEGPSPDVDVDGLGPLADDVEDRESVMYQPLPLKTMPTG